MNEITTYNHTVNDLQVMATAMARSGLFGVKTEDQAFALMLVAQAEGRHPATVAMDYDVIQNRPALKAQAALARFQAAGGSIKWIERTESRCKANFSHPKGGSLDVTWDMSRAERMGLTGKDNWRKQPGIMLQWRTVAEGVRAVFPACLNGVYLVEEVQDFDAPRHSLPPEKEINQDQPQQSQQHDVAAELAQLRAEIGQIMAGCQDDQLVADVRADWEAAKTIEQKRQIVANARAAVGGAA